MTRCTTPADARMIEAAEDLEHIVQDKRACWRADNARGRRRQPRYKKLLTRQLAAYETNADRSDADEDTLT